MLLYDRIMQWPLRTKLLWAGFLIVPLMFGLSFFQGKSDIRTKATYLDLASVPETSALRDELSGSEQPKASSFEGAAPSGQSSASNPIVKKIVYTASMDIEVKHYTSAYDAIMKIADETGSTVSSSTTDLPDGRGASGSIQLSVNPSELQNVMAQIAKVGAVRMQQTDSKDKTDSYVDLNARLINAQRVRERLVQVMRNQAGKLSDVLEVEREIARVGETIETLQGQIRYLEGDVKRSRLDIRLHEPYATIVEAQKNLWAEVRSSFNRAWNAFFSTVTTLLTVVGFLLGIGVYVGIGAGVYLLIKRYR